jgi:alginate export protein
MKRSLLTLLIAAAALNAGNAAGDTGSTPLSDATIATYTSEVLPNWFKLSGEFRTRVEGRTGFGFVPDNNDAYGLFRTRINVEFIPLPWLDVFGQAQDAHALGYDNGRPLATMEDPLDLRQAYIRFGQPKSWVKLTVGRQLLNYGAQRLIGPLDWTNVSRSFDAAKLELGTSDTKVDLFASSVVVNNPAGALDHSVAGHNLHGAYGSLKKAVPFTVFEPYVLWKTGGLSVVSGGFRLASAPNVGAPRGFDYSLEMIRQWSHTGLRDRTSYAGALMVGKTLPSPWKLRFSGEYDLASGNRNPTGKTIGTFDQMYPTNHLFYGALDIIGWQNMRQARVGADVKPAKKLQFNLDYRWDSLDSPRDALYDVAGKVSVKPKAGNTARDVGTELDFTTQWNATAQWRIGAGIGHLLPGEFLKLNSSGSSMTFPYAFVQRSF